MARQQLKPWWLQRPRCINKKENSNNGQPKQLRHGINDNHNDDVNNDSKAKARDNDGYNATTTFKTT